MQLKRGPTIPKKPHHLSDFAPNINKNTQHTTLKESVTSQHLPPRQADFTSTQTAASVSFGNKQIYSSNGLNSKTPHKPPRRRKATLTIQHLTLYSSSSPVNLLASSNSNNDSTTACSSSTAFGRQRASSSLQQSSQIHASNSSDELPAKPRRPSAPQMTSTGGHLKSSHSSQWGFDLFEQQQRTVTKDRTDNAKTSDADLSDSKPTHIENSTNYPSPHTSSTPLTSSIPSQHYTRSTPAPPTKSSSKYDGVIAQLVEMGFDATDAEAAVKSSKDFTIQSCLDILVQRRTSERSDFQNPHHAASGSSTTTSYQPPASHSSFFPATTTQPAPTKMESKGPSSFGIGKTQQQSHDGDSGGSDDASSSSDEDDILSNDQEWQRQQEARRRDYLESLKKEQQKQQEELRNQQMQQRQEELRKKEELQKQQKQHRKQQQQQQHQEQQEQQRQQQQQQQQQNDNRSSLDGVPRASHYTKSTPSEPPFNYRPAQHPRTSSSSSRSSTSSAFNTAPTTKPIGPDMIKKAVKARTRGNDLFKLGYYSEAEKSYNQALAILPERHDITVIVTNNRAAARLKNGQYQLCVADCGFVIEWARQKSTSECQTMVVLGGDITVRWYDQLGKALHRKAEALEKMVRLVDAQHIYEELLKMDASDAKALKGLERCQPPTKPPPPPRRTSPSATTKPATPARPQQHQQAASAFPGLDYSIFEINKVDEVPPSKAVAEMRARQAEIAKEESERMEKADLVNARIDRWKKGKEKNLRALLSSLDTLLWPGAQWRGAPINELLEPKKVKICYMKAIAKVHPDKLPASSTTVEQRLLASGIFSVLNQAWDYFRSTNKV